MSSNPILIGYAWSQAFDFTAGFLQVGDTIRAEFRQAVTDPTPITSVNSTAGTSISGNRVFLSLTPVQTALFKTGITVTGLVVVRAGVEIPLGHVITIPVAQFATRHSA